RKLKSVLIQPHPHRAHLACQVARAEAEFYGAHSGSSVACELQCYHYAKAKGRGLGLISHLCHSRGSSGWRAPIMITIELPLESDGTVQRARRRVMGLHFQAGTDCSPVFGPGGQGSNDPAAIPPPAVEAVGDDRFIAQQAVV